MNSVDAGASSVTVDVTPTKLTVVDTGRGFTTREEIEACFEVFGFEHQEGERVYGQFGIGRAQLWNFCSTVWRTNTFSMDVDIKKKGLDYDLQENLPQFDGLSIVGKFYERQKTAEIVAFEREIAELAAYAQIPVTVNGRLISQDPSKEKWTHESDDAWIRLKESGDLVVYNLGVKVRSFASWSVGSGGVVVTKPGVRLALNMARNDILVSECEVWKRIKPYLQTKSDERIRKKTTRLTEVEAVNLANRVATGELPLNEVSERKLITDIQGKNVTIEAFLDAISEKRPATVADNGTKVAERGHMLKYAYVLMPCTLTRFGVATTLELGHVLKDIYEKEYAKQPWRCRNFSEEMMPKLFIDDYKPLMQTLTADVKELPPSEWLPEETALIKCLSHTENMLRHALCAANVNEGVFLDRRRFAIGEAETALAWTDGRTRVTINRTHAAKAREGFAGMLAICSVLVHEFLHDDADTATHTHDFEFYDRYHRVMLHQGAEIGHFATATYALYVKELRRKGLRVLSRHITDLDRMMDGAELQQEEAPVPTLALAA